MSEEAAQKVATAAKQAKNAVNNIEKATELQTVEVVQDVIAAVPGTPRAQMVGVTIAMFVSGAASASIGQRLWRKRQEKKETEKILREAVVEEPGVEVLRPR